MLGEDSAAELIGLALPDDSHSGALEPEVEATDAGEQGSDGELTQAAT